MRWERILHDLSPSETLRISAYPADSRANLFDRTLRDWARMDLCANRAPDWISAPNPNEILQKAPLDIEVNKRYQFFYFKC